MVARINALYEKDRDSEKLKEYAEMLYDMAVVGEGGKLENPARFTRQVGALMAGALAEA